MNFYRVFPYDSSAGPTDRGGALFVPPASGYGRIDNPNLYDVLYVAAEAQAAIAESFGRFPIWRPDTFVNAGGIPYAIATIDAPGALALFEMNDVDKLRSIGIARPTDVVTRDRDVTQAWARKIFLREAFGGVSWWSFYNPAWRIAGFWNCGRLTISLKPEILTIDHHSVAEAATTIVRQISHNRP